MKDKQAFRTTPERAGIAASGTRPEGKIVTSIPSTIPTYRQVYEDLHPAIKTGAFQRGDRLPSETELGERYNTSRITVAKAVNELQLQGLVSRRAGSGTHVLAPELRAVMSSGCLFQISGGRRSSNLSATA